LGVDDRSEVFFSISHGTLPLQTILCRSGLGAKVSQDSLDRFSQSLHHMVDIELQMINLTFFFQHLKGRGHCNQFCGKIVAKLSTRPPALIALPFRNGMGYDNCNVHINSEMTPLYCVKIS